MTNMVLSNAQVNFFDVEINNEKAGGISPSTLDSAIDSLRQAPEDVIIEWCNDDTVMTSENVKEFVESVEGLRAKFGGDCTLKQVYRECIEGYPG